MSHQLLERDPASPPTLERPQPPQIVIWPTLRQQFLGPLGVISLAVLILVALIGYGIGAYNNSYIFANENAPASGSGQTTTNAQPTTTVPNATVQSGAQPAQFTVATDGAKEFHLTAKQVMWEVVKGHRVLAWTLDGMVPGPTIRVTAGDHVRITLTNQLREATTLHWHGLEIPAAQDGVPGVGQDPIKPGQSFTYDFTIPLDNMGTYFYHSHYDDLMQVSGGMYGAFIVDPKPGTPEAAQAIQADQEYLQMISELDGWYVINGKSFPDTQPIHVKHGQNIHIRLINIGELLHPMHLHGHFFTVLAEDGRMLASPYQKETIVVAPGESYDLVFNAWADPGSIYPFHCHILSHVMNPGQSMQEMGGLITLVIYDK